MLKILDIDGDLATDDDQFPGEGWTFDIDAEGGIASTTQVVTDDLGEAVFSVDIDGEDATITIAEVLETDFEIVDGFCFVLEDGEVVSDAFGLLEGETLTFIVEPGLTYGCAFYNTSGDVEEATATPRVTLPPTDMGTTTSAPQSDSWRILLVVGAALLASVLILTPAPVTARRR